VEIVVSTMPVLDDVPAGAVDAVLRNARAGHSRKPAACKPFGELDGAVAPIPPMAPACTNARTETIVHAATRVGILLGGPS
jgi:hypothetical protein